MKKIIVLFLTLCLLFSLTGCTLRNTILNVFEQKEVIFTIAYYDLQITADATFSEDTQGEFDLQITNGNCYISIMAYKYIDLPAGSTNLEYYELQNDDLLSRRENVQSIEKATTQTIPPRIITQSLYSAENNGYKNYYLFYLIDLPDDEAFAWISVTGMPSYIDAKREYLYNIVSSLEANE